MKSFLQLLFTSLFVFISVAVHGQYTIPLWRKIKEIKTTNCEYIYVDRIYDSIDEKVFEIEGSKVYGSGKQESFFFEIQGNTKSYNEVDRLEFILGVDSLMNSLGFETDFTSKDSNNTVYISKSENKLIIVESYIPLESKEEIEFAILSLNLSPFIKNEPEFVLDASFEKYYYPDLTREFKEGLGPWYDCGHHEFPNHSPPESHSKNNSNNYGISNEPSNGEQFISLVTRQDGSWESIGTYLKSPILQDSCYSFNIDLARSKTFESIVKEEGFKKFNTPISLRISLGNDFCENKQFIYESKKITNEDWKTHLVEFIAHGNYNYLIMEVFYNDFYAPNGNILIDNIHDFTIIDCGN